VSKEGQEEEVVRSNRPAGGRRVAGGWPAGGRRVAGGWPAGGRRVVQQSLNSLLTGTRPWYPTARASVSTRPAQEFVRHQTQPVH
jgi:hypothetical protein